MTARTRTHDAVVADRVRLSPHLVRLTLAGLTGFRSTGVPDEWVGLVVPGQYQSRYYTVRSVQDEVIELDVVVHDTGLVTEWVSRDCRGDRVTVTDPRGSFDPPAGARWLMLVGDLTALPAIARITQSHADLPTRVWAEVADDLGGYLPAGTDVTWLDPPAEGASRLADVVSSFDWPRGDGYFWMAGESSQMRAIRKHLMHERRLPSVSYDVMGYWRSGTGRQPRAVDPAPIWRAGRARGLSDAEIWADYDEARDAR